MQFGIETPHSSTPDQAQNGQKPLPTKLLYDRKSAAFALSISVRALDYLISGKQLATRRLGKKVMVPASELSRFARADHFTLTASNGRTA